MIEIAAILSLVTGDQKDFFIIAAMLIFNGLIGFWQENKAANALTALKGQLALTGESLPVNKKPGDTAYSGSVAKQGEMVAVVTATGAHTFFGRTAKLVASAGARSHFQQAVLRIGNLLIVNVPLGNPRLNLLDIKVDRRNALIVKFDALSFHEEWKGAVECRFASSVAHMFSEDPEIRRNPTHLFFSETLTWRSYPPRNT